MGGSHRITSGGRYPVLRALGILYMVAAAIGLAYGLYWFGWSLFAAPATFSERLLTAGGVLVVTFVGVVTVLAIAELIKLLIDIEHNTRTAAKAASNSSSADGAAGGGRMAGIGEESAEMALIRGH